MANVITPNYSFTLPEVGADTNAWGGHINGNFSTIDAQMLSRTRTAAQTMAGLLNLPANGLNVGSGQLVVSGGNVTASGSFAATGNLSGVNGTLTGTLSVTGASTLGNVSIGGTLGVTGAATFTAIPSCAVAPTTANHLTNKTYVDAGATSAQNAAVALAAPPSAVMAFARQTAPSGWLPCDGAAVSRTTYAALFAAIGTTFGSGDGSSTFNVPDMRGYFARGSGTNSDGTASGTFGAKQTDDIKPHTHNINDPSHQHVSFGDVGGGGSTLAAGAGYNVTSTNVTSASGTGITVLNTGTNIGTEVRPKNIALLYCIKT